MQKFASCLAVLTLAAAATAATAATTAPAAAAQPPLPPAYGPIYGSQLMTPAERAEHRTQMLNATSDQERDRLRTEHHEKMKERAKAHGITLPDMPPAAPRMRHRGPHRGGPGGMGPMGQGGSGGASNAPSPGMPAR